MIWYELLMFEDGMEKVFIRSKTFERVKREYVKYWKLCQLRIRVGGKLLTISEADKLCGMANTRWSDNDD